MLVVGSVPLIVSNEKARTNLCVCECAYLSARMRQRVWLVCFCTLNHVDATCRIHSDTWFSH